jgi:hypothetical protein
MQPGLLHAQNPRTNAYWNPNFTGSSGPIQYGASVSAMDASGNIYVAGNFQLGNESPIRVAKWSGNQWQVLGDRIYTEAAFIASSVVSAIAVDGFGNVYVGGTFNRAFNSGGGVVQCENVVKWNNAALSWEALGGGVSDDVTSIAIAANGDVYVSGNLAQSFNPDGSIVSTQRIAMWDDGQSIWQPLGDGLPIFTGGEIDQIGLDDNGDLVAAGRFSEIFDAGQQAVPANNIARWDGSGWHSLADGISLNNQSVINISKILSDGSGNLYVFGAFGAGLNGDGSRADGPLISWDGSRWTARGAGISGPIFRDMTIDGLENIYLLYDRPGFLSTLEKWDGNSWVRLMEKGTFPVPATIAANRQFGAQRCYMGGNYNGFDDLTTGVSTQIANNALWVGSGWLGLQPAFGIGASGEVFALAADDQRLANYLYVGGNFVSVDGVATNNIARFDGFNWSPMGAGVNGPVNAIEGSFWPWRGAFVGGVFSVATNPDGSTVNVDNFAFWDDATSRWYNVGGFDGAVNAIENTPLGRIIVGGAFTSVLTNAGAQPANALAQLDLFGQDWEPLGDGVAGQSGAVVNAITSWFHRFIYTGSTLGEIIVGGVFDTAINPDNSQTNVSNIAIWSHDARTWYSPGDGLDGEVLALERVSNLSSSFPIWAGGRFQNATNRDGSVVPANHVVRWDAYEWRPLGNGVDGPVRAITLPGIYSQAIIGGEFTNAFDADNTSHTVNRVALFDFSSQYGTTPGWNAFGDGVNGNVYALQNVFACASRAEIAYVGGDFSIAGSRNARSLAKWKYTGSPAYRGPTLVVRSSSGRRRNGSSGRGSRVVASVHQLACSPLAKAATEIVLADNLGFGEQTTAENLPVLTAFDLQMFDPEFPSEPLFTVDSLMVHSENPQLFVITGVDNPDEYAPNPDGRNTAETAILLDVPVDIASNEVQVVFVNSITDASALAVLTPAGDTLAASLRYGDVSLPVSLPPATYTFSVVAMSGGQQIASLAFNLSQSSQKAITAVLSGFVNPAANQNGPPLAAVVVEAADSGPTAVSEPEITAPNQFSLLQNYPNPFNPSTAIRYSLAQPEKVLLRVFDLRGREVATLVNDRKTAGEHVVIFDAPGLPSGIYFAHLKTGSNSLMRKMLLVR